MITLVKNIKRTVCHDCDAKIGNEHEHGCDVERCTKCKGQKLSCNCRTKEREKWSGIGWEEALLVAEERGLFVKWDKGWKETNIDDPNATHDLNAAVEILMTEARKNKNKKLK